MAYHIWGCAGGSAWGGGEESPLHPPFAPPPPILSEGAQAFIEWESSASLGKQATGSAEGLVCAATAERCVSAHGAGRGGGVLANAWDPWTIIGNDNFGDPSLGGCIGHATGLAVLGWPVTNLKLQCP